MPDKSHAKDKPHAVLIAWSYPPISGVAAYRTLRVSKVLVQAGWDVTVITAFPNNTATRMYSPDLERFIPPEVNVVRLLDTTTAATIKPPFRLHSRTILARLFRIAQREYRKLISLLSFPKEIRSLIRYSRSIRFPLRKFNSTWSVHVLHYLDELYRVKPFDVVWATIPPVSTGVLASFVSRQFKVPYLLDYRDLWIENPYFPGDHHAQQVEKLLLENASSVTTVTKGFCHALTPKTHTPVTLIHNGFDPDIFEKIRLSESLSLDSVLSITYAGTIYKDYDFTPLIEALTTPTINAALHIYGSINPGAKFSVPVHSQVVEFHGFAPSDQIHQKLKKTHIVLIVGVPDSSEVIPAKLYEALALRKPVIYLGGKHDEATEILQQCGLLLCASCDAIEIREALTRAYVSKQTDISLCEPDEEEISKYSLGKQAPLINEVFQDALTAHKTHLNL